MTATFLVEVETEGDTDLLGIAEDMKEVLDINFPFQTLSVKPWQRASAPTLIQPPPQQPL